MKSVNNPNRKTWKSLVGRPTTTLEELNSVVSEVFSAVQQQGDIALKNYTHQYDGVVVSNWLVGDEEIKKAENHISEELKAAIGLAKSNIERFHEAQLPEMVKVETTKGVNCWQKSLPIERVGLYVPGGSAPLFSTVLMLGIPAKIAGCKEIILCSPPNKNGDIHPAILYAAQLVGITKIVKLGGVQAIGALTFGTESVPSVYKIFGPGNQYVTAAKQMASRQGVAIDMPAGPSELLVVADDTANPVFVAADLLSQAEHGADSQVVCISSSSKFLDNVAQEIGNQLKTLPRKEIAEKALQNALLILMDNEQDIMDFTNTYAPEHLIVATQNNSFYIDRVINAGSVFIGNYTPESAGDYASGTNHTLPTNGFAKAYSGVNMDAFMKKITFQEITKEGLLNIGPAIEIMAQHEELEAHKNAVSVRINALNEENGNI